MAALAPVGDGVLTFGRRGGSDFWQAAESGNTKSVLARLNRGMNPNATNYAGDTALHKAALNGELDTCQALLKYGADPYIRTKVRRGGDRPPLRARAACRRGIPGARALAFQTDSLSPRGGPLPESNLR